MTPVGAKRGFTGAAIVALVICLALMDRFLARVESAEIESAARRSWLTGSRLLEKGKAAEALGYLRDAYALERQNPDYELQLITALTATGKTTGAEPLLTDILQREPNDGRANLVAARLMVRQGNLSDAEAYYHRAIYGVWPGNPGTQRVSARLELVNLLAMKNKTQELIPELISLEAESTATPEILKRVGELFLAAGAPARAADVYRKLVQQDASDITAYEGLGESELEQGHYRPAHEAFFHAFLRAPENESLRAHLLTLSTVTGLDPTPRELTSAEKYRRSIRILEMTRTALDQCFAKNGGNTDRYTQLSNTAKAMIEGKPPAHITNEIAEGVLSFAGQLWQLDKSTCGAPADQSALSLIMKRLTS